MCTSRRSIIKYVLLELLYMEMYVAWYIYVRTPQNWACAVSKGSIFYICREFWWLGFIITLQSAWTYNCLFFAKKQVTIKRFLSQKKGMYGWNPQKPTKKDGNDIGITILSHHPYILCHFANYAHHKTLYMHIKLHTQQGMQHCSLHSLPRCVHGQWTLWPIKISFYIKLCY